MQGCTCGVANVPNRDNQILGGSESAPHKYPSMIKETLQIFEASLTVFNASSVYNDNYEQYGPEQALTPVSLDSNNYWHSASDDDNPSITFKMMHEHEVLAVEVVDHQNCCTERFQSVEVRVGYTPSFEDAQSCGIQS